MCAKRVSLLWDEDKNSGQLVHCLEFEPGVKDVRFDFQTPMPVCRYMASLIPENVSRVLEPTPGYGNLVKAIKDSFQGYRITAPEDFFLLDKNQRFCCVVMNPPFSSKSGILTNAPLNFSESGMRLGYWFLTECMKMSSEVIALMPWFTISDSDVRLRFLRKFGLKSLTALPRKTFKYARIQTVVIHLSEGYQGETVFKVFDF